MLSWHILLTVMDSSEEDYHSADEDGGGTTAREEGRLEVRTEELVPSEKSTVEDEGQCTSEKYFPPSDGTKSHRTGAGEKNLAAVVGEEARVSPYDNETDPQRTTVVSGMEGSTGNAEETVRVSADSEGEYVTGLDNRYVSEDATIKGDKVELTEEQVKLMKEHANRLKKEGNDNFKSGDYSGAVSCYTEALKVYPPACEQEIAVCYANRGACHMKLEEYQSVVDDCTKALELSPDYLKALMRRAQSSEALEKYEDALEDYKRVLELDPSQSAARQALMYLPEKIKEQHEKLKDEMMGKLKELGNAILKPFGLSTQNFQLQQDPQSGGYSINFKR